MSTQSKNNNKEQYKSMVEPSYYAIIPANVRYSRDVCDGAKLLYAEITSLSNQHGYCWASNRYFSELYGKSEDTISRWISSLARAGFILTIVDSVKGNSRKIWLAHSQAIRKNADTLSAKMPIPYPQKCGDPIGKNADIILKENTKEEEEKPRVISQTSSPFIPGNFPLEEKEKNLNIPGGGGAARYEHQVFQQSPKQEQFSLATGVAEIRDNPFMRESFSISRRVPIDLFDSYLTDFSLEQAGVDATHHNRADLRKHFLNYSAKRYENEQKRKAADAPKPVHSRIPRY